MQRPHFTLETPLRGQPIGVVLAGGLSLRMRSAKPGLVIEHAHLIAWDAEAGRTLLPGDPQREDPPRAGAARRHATPESLSLLEWAVARLQRVCDDVVVAYGRQALPQQALGQTDSRISKVADRAGHGPIAGIVAAAGAAPARPLLVLACDLPLVRVATLRRLLEVSQATPSAAPSPERVSTTTVAWHDGRWQPLLAFYDEPALAALQGAVQRGHFALHRLIRDGVVEAVPFEIDANQPCGEQTAVLEECFNVNTPADFDRVRHALAAHASEARQRTHH